MQSAASRCRKGETKMAYDKLPDAAKEVKATARNFKSQLTTYSRTRGTNSNNSFALMNAANELYFAARYAARLALAKQEGGR
jgi:hypothetical protein